MTDQTQQAAIREAPDTKEMKAVGALLSAMHENGLDGALVREAMQWALAAAAPAVGAPVAEGMALVPDYRGYARLGTGQYVLNNSANDGEEPELIISIATEEEKAGRTVGEMRDNPPGRMLQPEEMCVRIRFANVAGLDALENQLRLLREECFASPPAASLREKEDAAHMFADFLLLKHCHAFINHENITKYLTEFDAQRLGREKEQG